MTTSPGPIRTPAAGECSTLRRTLAALLAAGTLLGATSCNSKIHPGQEIPLAQTTFSFDQPQASYDIFTEYHLLPGDVLDVLYNIRSAGPRDEFRIEVDHRVTVRFVDVPELTETQTVRPDGTISLPYLGVVPAAGRTVQELTEDLRTRYSALAQQPFRIGVDHVVTVKFLLTPELNETQTVRPDGTISLPYLGVVPVAGKTVAELTAELKTAFAQYVNKPELYVIASEPRTVGGEVRKKLQQPNLHVIVEGFREMVTQFREDLRTNARGTSRLVTVRPDGYATFPLVGDLFVARKTIPDVAQNLNERYGKLAAEVSVNLSLEQHAGSRIYVLGNVKAPGAFSIDRPTSLAQALALAGSFTPQSDTDSVIVFRRHEDKMVATKVDMAATLRTETHSVFFYLQPDDIVYVPRTALANAAEVMKDVASVLNFRGFAVNPVDAFINGN